MWKLIQIKKTPPDDRRRLTRACQLSILEPIIPVHHRYLRSPHKSAQGMSESRAMNVAEEGAAGASPAIAERLAAPSGGAQSVADTNGGAQSVARTWRHLLKRPPSGWRSSIAWNHFRSLKKIYYVAYDGAKSVENARVLESRPDAGTCKKKTVVCMHCSAEATTRKELVHSGYSFTGTAQMFQPRRAPEPQRQRV